MLMIKKLTKEKVMNFDLTGNVDSNAQKEELLTESESALKKKLFQNLQSFGPYSQSNPELDASYQFMVEALMPQKYGSSKYQPEDLDEEDAAFGDELSKQQEEQIRQ